MAACSSPLDWKVAASSLDSSAGGHGKHELLEKALALYCGEPLAGRDPLGKDEGLPDSVPSR
jgi:hypothetical protein